MIANAVVGSFGTALRTYFGALASLSVFGRWKDVLVCTFLATFAVPFSALFLATSACFCCLSTGVLAICVKLEDVKRFRAAVLRFRACPLVTAFGLLEKHNIGLLEKHNRATEQEPPFISFLCFSNNKTPLIYYKTNLLLDAKI